MIEKKAEFDRIDIGSRRQKTIASSALPVVVKLPHMSISNT